MTDRKMSEGNRLNLKFPRTRIVLVTAALGLFAAAADARASGNLTISGNVLDASGNPVMDVSILLRASRHDLSIICGRDAVVVSTCPCKPTTPTYLMTFGNA